jgi:Flp pilus assembly pilin Flp
MSAFLTFTAVRIQIAARALVERLADDERGQDTIEYLGVLLVVAALIAVVVGIVSTKLGSTIQTGAQNVINDVFNSGSKAH